MLIGFISIIAMVAVFGIIFVDYLQGNNMEADENTFELLAPQSYQ